MIFLGLIGNWRFVRKNHAIHEGGLGVDDDDTVRIADKFETYRVWDDSSANCGKPGLLHGSQFFVVIAAGFSAVSFAWGLFGNRFGTARMMLPALTGFFQIMAFGLYTRCVNIPM